jgi:hypothetical protein
LKSPASITGWNGRANPFFERAMFGLGILRMRTAHHIEVIQMHDPFHVGGFAPTSAADFGRFRRNTLLFFAASAIIGALPVASQARRLDIEVWKDPNCGCCNEWITHLQSHGFSVTPFNEGNNAARSRLGMPRRFASCHTALIDGYVIEGHVPAGDIQRLLKERPSALGLAVPGMPIGSPGMDGPEYGGRRDPYQVLLVNRDGSSAPFSTYR